MAPRRPNQLTPDELATLRMLWDVFPDELLMRRDRNHAALAGLIEDGYVTRTEYEVGLGEVGVGYRLAARHAAGLAKVTRANAEMADRN
jgi:hypothetical protein